MVIKNLVSNLIHLPILLKLLRKPQNQSTKISIQIPYICIYPYIWALCVKVQILFLTYDTEYYIDSKNAPTTVKTYFSYSFRL